MDAKSFHLTARGASHIRKDRVCQDASVSAEGETYALAVVCDGHGGNDYVRSDVGAQMACASAEKNIREFLKTVKEADLIAKPESVLKPLEASIINDWNESIYLHYAEHPFTEEEQAVLSEKAKKKYLDQGRMESAYGTTLIAVVMTETYWFGLHIGDGKCVAIDRKGEFSQPIPWDEKCFLNATTSMCDSRALEHFREYCSAEVPAAIFIGSDGIDDCFGNEQQLYHLYETMTYSFGTQDFEEAREDLEEYLPRLSAMGSGDDVSVAAVMDMDVLPGMDLVAEFPEKERRLREEREAQERARKEAEEKARKEAEEKARKEAEERARKEAEEEARRTAEEKARIEAEKARIEEERIRIEQERARIEEDRARIEAWEKTFEENRTKQKENAWIEEERSGGDYAANGNSAGMETERGTGLEGDTWLWENGRSEFGTEQDPEKIIKEALASTAEDIRFMMRNYAKAAKEMQDRMNRWMMEEEEKDFDDFDD